MPVGHTNRLLGSSVQRVDRQSSIFGGGKGFQPMPKAEMGQAPGRIQVVGGVFARQPFLGQLPPVQRPSPQVQMATPQTDSKQTQRGSAVPVEDGGKPGRRLAWGRMKKLEAQELSVYLAEIVDRMKAAGIPAGIVAQIKDKLDTFVKTAPAAGEVEISEVETQALSEAILELETVEQQEGLGIKTSTVLVVAGVGLLAAILFS